MNCKLTVFSALSLKLLFFRPVVSKLFSVEDPLVIWQKAVDPYSKSS